MSSHANQGKIVRVGTLLLLLANYAMSVNAAPLGAAEFATSRFYWMLLLAVMVILSLIYYFSKTQSPVKVVGLAYDKSNHKLELTVQNTGDETFFIKSAMRLLQPAQEAVDAAADGKVPMASAHSSSGNRRMFQLLAEDDAPMSLAPNETRTLTYGVLLPAEFVKLDDSKNVEVHISYSEESEVCPHSQEASGAGDVGNGFRIRMDSGEVIAEAFLLEDLLEAVRKSPDESIEYHMKNGNDFGQWVKNVLGDTQLAQELDSIKLTSPKETRNSLISVIDGKVESLKHPYLRKVSQDKSFHLKTDHDKVVSEVLLLEDLARALESSTAETVSFHMQRGNDFATWVKDAVGDTELSTRISKIDYSKPDFAKNQLVSAINERVDFLKC